MPKHVFSKRKFSICLGVAALGVLLLLMGASTTYAGESCGGEGERGCCLFEQFPSCDNDTLIEDLTPSCKNKLGRDDCLCRGKQTAFVNPFGTLSLGVCRKKKGVGEKCEPLFDPCLPGLQCRAVGFKNALIQYTCFANLDERVSDAQCNAIYNKATHDAAVATNATLSFGAGFAGTAGVTTSTERGVVYGRDGCYGCYDTSCFGGEVDLNVSTFAVQSESDVDVVCDPDDADCISFDGEACVAYTGIDIPLDILGISIGALSVPGCFDDAPIAVGSSQSFSIGLGINPIELGLVDCTTQLKVTACLDDNGDIQTLDNTPPQLALSAYTLECSENQTFELPSGAATDPDGDPLTYTWSVDSDAITLDDPTAVMPMATLNTALSQLPGCKVDASLSLTVTDPEGLSASQTGVPLVLQDTQPPRLVTGAADATVESDGAGNQAQLNAWLNTQGGAAAGDLCTGEIWVDDFVSLSDGCGETGAATVTFTPTDACGNTGEATTATFTIVDTTSPSIDTAAADQTVECDGAGSTAALSAWLASQGGAQASDTNGNVTWSHDFSGLSDQCGATGSATVTFTATDQCSLNASTSAVFTLQDTTPPDIQSNAPAMITPPDAPIAFTATASDVCSASNVSVTVERFDCYFYNGAEKRIDKTDSCVVQIAGDTITILDSGGVADFIEWTVRATDQCGVSTTETFSLTVVKPTES
jgi:hypothetical protein